MVPAVSRVTVAGLPLTLLLLGFGFYPVLFAVGWFYNRQARQLAGQVIDLVDPLGPALTSDLAISSRSPRSPW